jgi:tetratricopeptide (TPR) repeat protein
MMKKNVLYIFCSCVFVILNSCSEPTKEYVLKVKLNKLTYTDIYDYHLVKDVIFDAEELNLDSLKKKSRESFLKGVDEYKNKKNISAAILCFKQSIVNFPDAKTYYELGNALLEDKTNKVSLEEAMKAYRVAEVLEIKPLYSVYYKMACAENMIDKLNSKKEENYSVFSYLRRSFQAGFYDTVSIAQDTRINSIIGSSGYKSMLLELKSKNLNGDKNSLFELYKSAYPIHTEGYEVSVINGKGESDESISYDFSTFVPEMQNTSFGREVSNDFFYVANVKETAAYTALIYTSVSFWGGEESGPMPSYTSIVTYDPTGIIIDRKLIACDCSAEKVKTAKIIDDIVYVEDFDRLWKRPIDEVSFDENDIDQYIHGAKLTYVIHEDGTITAAEIPANYIDTVITKKQTQNTPL